MSLKVKGQYDNFIDWIDDISFYLNKTPSDIQARDAKEYVVTEQNHTVAYWDRLKNMGWIEKE